MLVPQIFLVDDHQKSWGSIVDPDRLGVSVTWIQETSLYFDKKDGMDFIHKQYIVHGQKIRTLIYVKLSLILLAILPCEALFK